MDGEVATCICLRCGCWFYVLADEYADHPCPRCGGVVPEDEEEEDEE